MCEMLGVSSRERRRLNELLREFYSHADAHPHGWGLALFPDGRPSIEKEPVCATRSERLAGRLASPIEEKMLLAHIRLATIGTQEYVNCHPFTATDNQGRAWTLVHNGTIFGGARLNGYMRVQSGETDSERVLLHVVDMIGLEQTRLGRALNDAERFDLLYAEIADLAEGNKLNLIVSDGEFIYAHCNFKGALHVRREEGEVVFSTRALSGDGWEDVPFTSLVAAKDGEIVRVSPPHGNEYIYNPDDYRMVYMDFARL